MRFFFLFFFIYLFISLLLLLVFLSIKIIFLGGKWQQRGHQKLKEFENIEIFACVLGSGSFNHVMLIF